LSDVRDANPAASGDFEAAKADYREVIELADENTELEQLAERARKALERF